MTQHYDPNQPRVPVGHHDGGQWTGDSSSPGIPERGILEQSGLLDAILGLGDAGSRDGTARLAFLDPQKPPPIKLPQPKPAPRIPLVPKIPAPLGGQYLGAALALYSLLSGLNDDEQQTIISFRSREYRRNGPKSFDLEDVQILTWEETRDICGDNFEEVQKLADEKFKEVKNEGKPLSPTQFGTEVHKRIEDAINSQGNEDFRAEMSFAKGDGADRRNAKDTVRLDVFNRVNEKTICIDDVKTGQSELSYRRMRELVASVSRKDENVERIIVTEVRPKGMRPPKPRPPTLQSE